MVLEGSLIATFLVAMNSLELNGLAIYFISVFPHDIFEELGTCYCASLGIFMCIESSKKISQKWRGHSVSLIQVGKQILRSYILVIVPLYLIAAIIEGFITPLLVAMFRKTLTGF